MLSSSLRRALKAAALPFGFAGRRRPGDVVVLLYHRVGDGRSEIDLPEVAFERHLATLVESGSALPLEEAIAGSRGGVVVSVDDGSADFAETVVPLLVRYGVPAVLYLATGSVANGGSSRSDALTWAQLRGAVATGLVAVGSHTHSHADLSRAGEREAEEEMRRSKELIEDRLGAPCRHFAYPWAVGSVAADRVARRLFDSAALAAWRTNRAGRIDPYRLGRVPVLRSDGQFFFRRKVNGELDAEGALYRIFRRGPWRLG